MSYGFVANFIRFPAVQKNENRLRICDKVTDSLKVGTFLRHNVDSKRHVRAWLSELDLFSIICPILLARAVVGLVRSLKVEEKHGEEET